MKVNFEHMVSSKRLFIIILILVVVTSCKKSLIEIDPNYIGSWSGFNHTNGASYFLSIDSTGYGYYNRNFYGGGEAEEIWKGEVKSTRTHIKIAQSPCFKIIEAPTPVDTNFITYNGDTATWEMKLKYPQTLGFDGAEFTIFR